MEIFFKQIVTDLDYIFSREENLSICYILKQGTEYIYLYLYGFL